MNGKVAGVEQTFVGANEAVDDPTGAKAPMKPAGNIWYPPLHKHCLCDIVAD